MSYKVSSLIIYILISGIHCEYIVPKPKFQCPTNQLLIHPCDCYGESDSGTDLVCEHSNLAKISVSLNNLAFLNMVINNLTIFNCYIKKLYGPLFYKVTSRTLFIKNTPIEDIDAVAFYGINNTLNDIYLINSKLKNFPRSAFQHLGNLINSHIHLHSITELYQDDLKNSQFNLKLIKFTLSDGLLNSIHPETFQPLKKLKFLDLHGNKLKLLKKNQFKGLKNLELLDLSYNYISKIDASHMTDLNKLLWINISHNDLKEITRGSFAKISNLRLLKLSQNKIKKIDSNAFRGLRHLRRLYLSDNEINEIARKCFSAISNIATIALNKNRLTKIDFQMFYELKSIEIIDLSENNITVIEKQAFKDLYLVNINLSRNAIETIEQGAFENCNNITNLDLSFNQISEITKKAFDENSYASEFILSFNKLTNFSQIPLSNMTGLKILNVSHNKIQSIPKNSLPKLYELHTIDLSNNEITEITNAVFHPLLGLRYLNLSQNYLRKINFATFGTIFSLLELKLDFNQIQEIASSAFLNLASVRQLFLRHNYITKIFKLPVAVSELYLSYNQIDSLPENSWPVMNSLLVLDLSYNRISNNLIPTSFEHLLTLQLLNLNGNNITQVPYEPLSKLPSLRILYLKIKQDNRLTKLKSKAFGKLPVVSELHLSENQLNNISENAFDGLLQVLLLNMSHNNLFQIPNGAFHGLISMKLLDLSFNLLDKLHNKTNSLLEDCLSLEKLNLSNNKFGSINRKTFPTNPYIPYCLADIDLSFNSLTTLTFDITFGTKKLKTLNLSHNSITEIRPNVIGNLTSLKILDLSNNMLEEFPRDAESIQLPKNLTIFNLSNNHLKTLPWKSFKNLSSINNLKLLNLAFNEFEYFYPDILDLIKNSTDVILNDNPWKCNCLIRSIKQYLNSLKVLPSIYKDLECKSPEFLSGTKFNQIDNEETLQCSINSKYAYLNQIFDSDYKIRNIEIKNAKLKINWLVTGNSDIADCFVIIRNRNKPLEILYRHIVPYFRRELFIEYNNSWKIDNLFNSLYELCLVAIDSQSTSRKLFEFQQCSLLSQSLVSKSVIAFAHFPIYCFTFILLLNSLYSFA